MDPGNGGFSARSNKMEQIPRGTQSIHQCGKTFRIEIGLNRTTEAPNEMLCAVSELRKYSMVTNIRN